MRTLVVGATGLLGGAIARKLLATGVTVRALGRNRTKLAALAELGAETVSCDLLDAPGIAQACKGVDQICTTANNVMGRGASSPNRVDIPAHVNLCAGATHAGVRRFLYVSAYESGGADSPVDYFRVKDRIETIVKGCGVPWVMLRPTAFMDIWVPMIAGDIQKKGVAMIFGNGTRLANFIAVEDVAEITVRILTNESIQNESIDIGGPANISLEQLVVTVERELGVSARRRHMPAGVLRFMSVALRPFHEVASRMMSLGYFMASRDNSFADWRATMDRFGVTPMTLEAFVKKEMRK